VETVTPGIMFARAIPRADDAGNCISGQPTMCALRDKPRWFMLDGTFALSQERPASSSFSPGRWLCHPHRPARAKRDSYPEKDAPLDLACLVSCGVLRRRRSLCSIGQGATGSQCGRVRLRGVGSTPFRPPAWWARARSSPSNVNPQKLTWAEEFGAHPRRGRLQGRPCGARARHQRHGRRRLCLRVVGTQKTIEQALASTHRGGTCVVGRGEPRGHAPVHTIPQLLQQRVLTARPSEPAPAAPTCRCAPRPLHGRASISSRSS
jgi:Zn-dependent alcohol dehydrogenase